VIKVHILEVVGVWYGYISSEKISLLWIAMTSTLFNGIRW
jgi:hypothetical protein